MTTNTWTSITKCKLTFASRVSLSTVASNLSCKVWFVRWCCILRASLKSGSNFLVWWGKMKNGIKQT